MSDPSPVNLHFEDSGKWYSLPEWAEFFIGVGKQLVAAPHTDSRLICAIVVPTRAFGAAFTSLGMVIADAAPKDHASAAAHFQTLFDLPAGTHVVYRRPRGGALKGILRPPEERDGQLWIRVQVHSPEGGGTTYWIKESDALLVQPAGRRSLKLPKKQSPFNVRTINKFVDGLLGETDPVQLNLRSKFVCAIVGRRNVLEYEVRKTPLALHINGNPHAEGQLQDVLRVESFVNSQQSHRSAIVSAASEAPSDAVISGVETGVVFDGASGFLKWGAAWRDRHQVIILDRTERHFDDAISAVNTRFSQNRIQDGSAIIKGDAPPGGEFLAFREGAQ